LVAFYCEYHLIVSTKAISQYQGYSTAYITNAGATKKARRTTSLKS